MQIYIQVCAICVKEKDKKISFRALSVSSRRRAMNNEKDDVSIKDIF